MLVSSRLFPVLVVLKMSASVTKAAGMLVGVGVTSKLKMSAEKSPVPTMRA